jgi:hypothetical protein
MLFEEKKPESGSDNDIRVIVSSSEPAHEATQQAALVCYWGGVPGVVPEYHGIVLITRMHSMARGRWVRSVDNVRWRQRNRDIDVMVCILVVAC